MILIRDNNKIEYLMSNKLKNVHQILKNYNIIHFDNKTSCKFDCPLWTKFFLKEIFQKIRNINSAKFQSFK